MTGKVKVSFRRFITDPNLLGWAYRDPSYDRMKVLAIGLMGEPLTEDERIIWRDITGLPKEPEERIDELLAIVGRRGSKGMTGAAIALYHATCIDYRNVLFSGERAEIVFMAATQTQAARMWKYCRGALENTKLLKPLIERKTNDCIELTNGNSLIIQAANFRSARGGSSPLAIVDELAYLMADGAALSDVELLNALRPSLSNLHGMLCCFTTPYAKSGETWRMFQQYGDNHDPKFLVIKKPSRALNPSLKQSLVDHAFERDPIVAMSEYGSLEAGIEFRPDLATFIDRDVIQSLVMTGCGELLPAAHQNRAFADPAGGSGQDAFALAISHSEMTPAGPVAVLDCIRQVKPPFSPTKVVAELSAVLRSYGLGSVMSDRYGGGWPAEAWGNAGITVEFSEKSKSEIYCEVLRGAVQWAAFAESYPEFAMEAFEVTLCVAAALTKNELEKIVSALAAQVADLQARIAVLEPPKQETPPEEPQATDWADAGIIRGYEMISAIMTSPRKFGSIG